MAIDKKPLSYDYSREELDRFTASHSINSLYDERYIRNIDNAKIISYSNRNLKRLYDNPSDKFSYVDQTLVKKGKTDTSVVYFSPQQLYNRDGRYGLVTAQYPNTTQVNDSQSVSKFSYITNYNSFINSSTRAIQNEYFYDPNTGRMGILQGNMVRGAIDTNAGKPIRLTPPTGFYGYINCLTKGNPIGKIDLSSAPQNISDNVSVENASDTAIGRSQGFNFFSNVGTRQVQFTFDAYADYLPSPFMDVLSYCRALKQMNYPTYSSGGEVVNSPVVNFTYGGISITGIPTITFTFDNTIRKGVIDKATISVNIIETTPITDGRAIL